MGRIAELFEKKANGSITDAELKELDQLQKEAELLATKNKDGDTENQDETTEEEAVEELAQKLADSVTSKIDTAMDKVLKGLENKDTKVEIKHQPRYIVDAKLGKKSVDELAEIKVAIPERKDKSVKEVSLKTVHVVQAMFDGDVQKLQLLLEGTGARGGYLVPEEFANMIVEDIRDVNIMRQIAAAPMTISGDTLHLPNLANRPKAAWRGEAAVKNTSTVDFGEQVFTPYSLATIVGLSNELVADASLGVSGSIVNYVSGLMAVSLSEEEEKAFWTGNGTGKPTGVDGGAYTLRTVAAGAGATDAQKADAILAAFHRTPQGYRNKGVWVANSGTWEEIARVKDSQGRYLLTGLADSPTQSLKGRPVYEQNNLAGGTLLYGDFSYYQIVDREGISIRVSDEATVGGQSAFEQNLTYIRVEKRVDAELTLPAAITKVTGMGTI